MVEENKIALAIKGIDLADGKDMDVLIFPRGEMELFLDARQKQIPTQAIKTDTCSQACPVCKAAVNRRYCPNCGQKIDYGTT